MSTTCRLVTLQLPILLPIEMSETELTDLFNTVTMDIQLLHPQIPFKDLMQLIRSHATNKGQFTEKDYNQLRKANANPQTN